MRLALLTHGRKQRECCVSYKFLVILNHAGHCVRQRKTGGKNG